MAALQGWLDYKSDALRAGPALVTSRGREVAGAPETGNRHEHIVCGRDDAVNSGEAFQADSQKVPI
ncbi:hypothetical protein N7449_006048 [Penicillium cf. viridicatum]|uniref:Uncharacterized protein n=1 Tax=Penicillium cf. viridicatum TaxID=2972119 RepID=A0A9W9SWW9_9EURO|nr:hypothetical protein N7449_006048 [Penicillium cf. viridicatum]